MKVLGIVGSPHGVVGNTYRLVKSIMTGAENLGANTETVILDRIKIESCIGCATCLTKGDCPKKDGMKELIAKMIASDGIVLGSPVYFMNVTGQVKTFIDRTLPYGHRPRMLGKYGGSATVYAGVGSADDVADYLNNVLYSWGLTPVGKVCGFAAMPGEIEKDREAIGNAVKLGEEIVRAYNERRPRPKLTEEQKRFSNALKNLISDNRNFMKADYEFWKDKLEDQKKGKY